MIISKKHKFIFVKTSKVAGTSLELYLSKFCADYDIVTPIYPKNTRHKPRNYCGYFNILKEIKASNLHIEKRTVTDFIKRRRFYNHIEAWRICSRISEKEWNSYFKFTIERNPFDKVISHYNMIRSRRGEFYTFDKYLKEDSLPYNYKYYTDYKQEKIIVDYIIKYEKLNEQLSNLLKMLSIPFEGKLSEYCKKYDYKKYINFEYLEKNNYLKMIKEKFKSELKIHKLYIELM